MLAKAKQLKTTAEKAGYEDENYDNVNPGDTALFSYKTANIIRMELQDQRKAEKQALKSTCLKVRLRCR